MTSLVLWRNARVSTLEAPDWGMIERGAVISRGGQIVWVGEEAGLPKELAKSVEAEHDLGGNLLTPGLVDCHTHLVYGGQRAHEFEMRLEGVSYEAIAQAGGGILSSVRATREAAADELLAEALKRVRHWVQGGVSTLEIKSGYGLSLEDEARCLRVARQIGVETGLDIKTTFLGAHSLPPEYKGRSADYVEAVCGWIGLLQEEGLADAVDAFCENIAFSSAEVRRIFGTAKAAGLPVKLHAEQLSDQNGAALAAEFGALSCDHLEYLSADGIAAMKAAGTVAVLLPGAYYFLRETKLPPVQGLREAGVPIAISTDHNPGTSPCFSLPLMANMACTLFRMTPFEAVCGMTFHAAKALGLSDRGRLAPGLRADMAVWELNHPRELAYGFGRNPCLRTVVAGRTIWQD